MQCIKGMVLLSILTMAWSCQVEEPAPEAGVVPEKAVQALAGRESAQEAVVSAPVETLSAAVVLPIKEPTGTCTTAETEGKPAVTSTSFSGGDNAPPVAEAPDDKPVEDLDESASLEVEERDGHVLPTLYEGLMEEGKTEREIADVIGERLRTEYDRCASEIGKFKEVIPDEICRAIVTGDPSLCAPRGADLESECRLIVHHHQNVHGTIARWAKAGFPGDPCGNRVLSHMEYYTACHAAKAGLEGGSCGDRFPEGSTDCMILNWFKEGVSAQECFNRVAAGEHRIPPDLCTSALFFEPPNCPEEPPLSGHGHRMQEPSTVCAIVDLLKEGAEHCEGRFSPDSPECMDFAMIRAIIDGDPMICEDLPGPFLRCMCRAYAKPTAATCDTIQQEAPVNDKECRKFFYFHEAVESADGQRAVHLRILNPYATMQHCLVRIIGDRRDQRNPGSAAVLHLRVPPDSWQEEHVALPPSVVDNPTVQVMCGL